MKYLLSESQFKMVNEEFNALPLRNRWVKERRILKNFLINYGETMISKENGKEYKVLYNKSLSDAIGFNYCICLQWDTVMNDSGDIIYVRAYDKFTPKVV